MEGHVRFLKNPTKEAITVQVAPHSFVTVIPGESKPFSDYDNVHLARVRAEGKLILDVEKSNVDLAVLLAKELRPLFESQNDDDSIDVVSELKEHFAKQTEPINVADQLKPLFGELIASVNKLTEIMTPAPNPYNVSESIPVEPVVLADIEALTPAQKAAKTRKANKAKKESSAKKDD